jgi:hypothetical protein
MTDRVNLIRALLEEVTRVIIQIEPAGIVYSHLLDVQADVVRALRWAEFEEQEAQCGRRAE